MKKTTKKPVAKKTSKKQTTKVAPTEYAAFVKEFDALVKKHKVSTILYVNADGAERFGTSTRNVSNYDIATHIVSLMDEYKEVRSIVARMLLDRQA